MLMHNKPADKQLLINIAESLKAKEEIGTEEVYQLLERME